MKLLGSKRIRTTAYHPASNGMVERLHRQLKAALKAHQRQDWVEVLPFVLLGIRTSLKTDVGCSAAELVYGTTLRLPGEFFASPPADACPDPADYATRLRETMKQLRATAPRLSRGPSTFVSDELATGTHVFLRHDAVRKPLQPPYDGPYKVLRRGTKTMTLDIRGRQEVVALDRVKPAHLDSAPSTTLPNLTPQPKTPSATTPIPLDHLRPQHPVDRAHPCSSSTQQPHTRTRSGRHVYWPARLGIPDPQAQAATGRLPSPTRFPQATV